MTNLRNRLRWPEAEWDVSGAFAKDAVLLRFYDFCKKRLGYAPFAVVHGSPLFHWNCGRVLSMLLRSDHEINTAAAEYVKRGIPVDLTFTNVNLKEADMKDVLGNRLLRFFAERSTPDMQHAVIIGSDALYNHVKTNYPRLKTVSSILRITCDGGKGKLDSYLRLAEKYDKVMIHPDDVFNYELLEKLEDKGRYELILNEYCMRNCPIRAFHYTTMAEQAPPGSTRRWSETDAATCRPCSPTRKWVLLLSPRRKSSACTTWGSASSSFRGVRIPMPCRSSMTCCASCCRKNRKPTPSGWTWGWHF